MSNEPSPITTTITWLPGSELGKYDGQKIIFRDTKRGAMSVGTVHAWNNKWSHVDCERALISFNSISHFTPLDDIELPEVGR